MLSPWWRTVSARASCAQYGLESHSRTGPLTFRCKRLSPYSNIHASTYACSPYPRMHVCLHPRIRASTYACIFEIHAPTSTYVFFEKSFNSKKFERPHLILLSLLVCKLFAMAMFPLRYNAQMSTLTRYTLRRNTENLMKGLEHNIINIKKR